MTVDLTTVKVLEALLRNARSGTLADLAFVAVMADGQEKHYWTDKALWDARWVAEIDGWVYGDG